MEGGLALLCLLGSITGSQVFKTSVDVEENGAEYKQTVEYDAETMAVTIHVPAHKDIDASTTIIHKQLNIQMLMDPMRKICLHSTADENFDPVAEVLSSYSLSARRAVVRPRDAKEVYKMRLDRGKLGEQEMDNLPFDMKKLCGGLTITRIEEVEVTRAEYESGMVDRLNSTNIHRRAKRSINRFISCGGQTSDRCTDAPINGGHYCRWYTCNTRNVGGDCNLEHIRTGNWQCTVCCEPRKDGAMCKCDEIRDDASFVRCQGKLWDE